MCVCVCQGEPGVPGSRGPEGTQGVGTQGEKVNSHLLLSVTFFQFFES